MQGKTTHSVPVFAHVASVTRRHCSVPRGQ